MAQDIRETESLIERMTVDALEHEGVVDKKELKARHRKMITERWKNGDIPDDEMESMLCNLSDKRTDAKVTAMAGHLLTPPESMFNFHEVLHIGGCKVVLAKNAGVEANDASFDLFEENHKRQADIRDKKISTRDAVNLEIMSGRATNCADAIANLVKNEAEYYSKGIGD